jgi:hypothetical protein
LNFAKQLLNELLLRSEVYGTKFQLVQTEIILIDRIPVRLDCSQNYYNFWRIKVTGDAK